jgi:ABC-2 type transport system permease protein
VKVSLRDQIGHVARRSMLKTLRQPLIVGPTLIFPLFFLAITAPGLEGATEIKGFPTDSYLSFAMGMIFVQAALNAVTTAGGGLAEDIQTGFLSRLSLTPLTRVALIIGSLAGTVVLAAISAVIYIGVGLVFGAEIEAGVGGAVALVALTVLFSIAFGAIGMFVALRTGDAESVQAVFPLLFALFFLSSMAMPRNLIQKSWFETVATYNPLSYLIEAVRSLLITGWDEEALALGTGIGVAICIIFLAAAGNQVGARLVRA